MQPFKPQLTHPKRGALSVAGQEIERRSHAQPDAARVAALSDCIGDHFLLRGADTDEGETRGLSRSERGGIDYGGRILFQTHRRFVPAHVAQTISSLQPLDRVTVRAEDGNRLIPVDNRVEQVLDQVRARCQRQFHLRGAGQALQHAAVVQQHPGMVVKRTTSRFIGQADDVIDIRCRHIGETQIQASAGADRVERASEVQTAEPKAEKINFVRSADACIERHRD